MALTHQQALTGTPGSPVQKHGKDNGRDAGRTAHSETPPFEIGFRAITDLDYKFLCRVYESTRRDEMALTGWPAEKITEFLRSQFRLQHTQYLRNYENASLDIILVAGVAAGRLYVDRRKDDIRIIDIALLPKFRKQGIGTKILSGLTEEADRKGLTLSLHVEYNNHVVGFYERLGFKMIHLNGIYFFMRREPVAHGLKIKRKRRQS